MSIEAMSHVLSLDVKSSTRKLVLLGFANHAHKDGTSAFCAVGTVAEYANCDARSAKRHVGWLLDHGYMREGDQSLVDHLPGNRRPIVYEVAMSEEQRQQWLTEGRTADRRDSYKSAGQRATDAGGDNLSPQEEPARGDNGDQVGVTDQAPRGGQDVTQTVSEPSLEPSESSLRSDSAGSAVVEALAGQPGLPLDGIPTAPDTKGVSTETAVEAPQAAKPVDPNEAAARDIIAAFHAWYEREHSGPIVGSSRAYWGLVRSIVAPALAKGYTDTEVRLALTACGRRGVAFPTISQWQAALSEVRSGRSLSGRPAPANRHRDHDAATTAYMAEVDAAWGATG
jgi:hypothetical protein